LVTGIAALAVLFWHDGSRGDTAQPTPASALSHEEAEGVIFERQQLMLQLDEDAKKLGMIAAGSAPVDGLAQTTSAIAQTARESVAAFEQTVPGGRSKPEVWADQAKFMADMERFARNAEAMAEAGASGNLNAVTNLMIDALPCKQCHDRYRAPKSS
jgi:cytochrome c556